MPVTVNSNLSSSQVDFIKDVPSIRQGLGLDQVWFSGGRTAVTLLRHGGIGQILYFGRQAMPFHNLFKVESPQSAWEKLFRLCVLIDGVAFYPEFNCTSLLPHGYTSTCMFAQVRLQHELTVLNDAVVQRVRILANPADRKVSLRLCFHGFVGVKSGNRKWGEWKATGPAGVLYNKAVDSYTPAECREQIEVKRKEVRENFLVADVAHAETHIAIASDLKCTHLKAGHGYKHHLNTGTFTDEASFFIAFAPQRKALERRVTCLRRTVTAECEASHAAYRQRLATSPRIRIPSAPTVQSCLANIPAVIDAVEVRDIPGGFRAAMHGYWLWLDLFFNASAFTYANDAASLRDMLLLYRTFADPRMGIPALVTTELKPYLGATTHTQCLFITALYHYHCNTGDDSTLRQLFPFVARLMDASLQHEVADTGLIEGAGLPDFPAEQDGHDLCSSGNSIHYQSLRVMVCLARALDASSAKPAHAERAARYDAAAERCRTGFLHHFWDHKRGYFIDSVSSRDLSKRRHYPVFAIQWATHFAADLLGDHVHEIAAFMAANFTRPHGIAGMIPTWDTAYPCDGNQFQAYYPSWTESFYRNVMRLAGRKRELERWFDDVAWFWQQNTVPEGFTYDAENEGFTVDNPGTKQAFAGQAWYCVFFRCIIGLDVDVDGLVITPTCVRRQLSVRGLLIRGKTINITVSGERRRGTISCNGTTLRGRTIRIPFGDLAATNTIVI